MGTPIALFIGGLVLVIFFSEKLVKGAVGTSRAFGISAFAVSVLFIGFDPENLALGSVASSSDASGIALGTIFGAAMVAIALAFGITALFAPMEFSTAPAQVLVVPLASVLLIGVLSLDGLLSRLDGLLLILSFAGAIVYLFHLTRQGLTITPGGEVAEVLEEENESPSKIKYAAILLGSLIAIVLGSEMLLSGSRVLIIETGISETAFGMTFLALCVSVEELARELPAALKGRSDITYGNVAGSVMAFFLFNAGFIALIEPVPVSEEVLYFHLPVCLATVFFISICMLRRQVKRVAGALLVLIYIFFFVGNFYI